MNTNKQAGIAQRRSLVLSTSTDTLEVPFMFILG